MRIENQKPFMMEKKMRNPIIKRGCRDHDDIERLQLALHDAGFDVDFDGMFGPGVERAVRAFQEAKGLKVDSVVAEKTWGALAQCSKYGRPLELDLSETLPGFRGDMAWIHRWEGHAGKPYWPGAASGVTLDPGLDLGHAAPELIAKAFGSRLSSDQLAAVHKVLGIRGEEAKSALKETPGLDSIRVLRTTATEIFPFVAQPYWRTLCKRFESLVEPSTSSAVQTAMLSLGYNRGAHNKALAILKEPIANGQWQEVGKIIGAMQQDHSLDGIRRRRRAEGELIISALS
jgi:peptidoglycan hydrolase-like protein with peptidoglycan-binding domain